MPFFGARDARRFPPCPRESHRQHRRGRLPGKFPFPTGKFSMRQRPRNVFSFPGAKAIKEFASAERYHEPTLSETMST